MRLAETEWTICVDGSLLLLRPTLRAAYRLERGHKGFDVLARAVADGTLHVISDVILEGCPSSTLNKSAIETALCTPLSKLEAIIPTVLTFILALCGIDEDAPVEAKASPSPAPMSFADHHAKLYRIATGWLGWTPADAWNATPVEIIEAFKGRSEMLNAIFGAAPTEESSTRDTTRDEAGWQSFKMFAAMGGNKGV